MKIVRWALLTAAVLVSAWSLFIVAMMPLAICDTIFEPIRSESQKPHTDGEAGEFAGKVCGWVGLRIGAIRWSSVVPLIVLNAISCLAFWRVSGGGRPAPGSTVGLSGPPGTPSA